MPVPLLLLAAASLGVGASQASDARDATRNEGRANKAIAQLENARTRRRQIRESRIAIGTIYGKSATTGGGGGFGSLGSSGTRGKAGGVISQLGSNLDYLDEATRLSAIASDEGIRAAGSATKAGTAQGAASAFLTANSLYNTA